MRRRWELIGGSYELVSLTGKGTTVAFKLPLRETFDAPRQ